MQTNIDTVLINRMTPEDVDGVIQIEQSAYGDHHWSRESFIGEISNELARYYALHTPDGKLAGYAGCWHILEEAHITTIAISPEYRRRKYAEALLKRIIDDCYKEKIKYITLEVRVSNAVAISCYERCNFVKIAERKRYYSNGEDALIMEKIL